MEFNKNQLPEHIAIILDGNRRWAKAHGKPTAIGHKEGAKRVENIVRYANKIGIKYLTVYAFSTENWKRTQEEVQSLMLLMQKYINDFLKKADSENIKINIIGDITEFPPKLQQGLIDNMERTKNNTGVTFNIALNYGGRAEIVRATKLIATDVINNKLKIEDISEEDISAKLYTSGQPDPDLLIRTSGEIRLSNFLPWQLVYSEFLFVDKNWPDFTEEDLDNAIIEYQKRTRKFGAN